MIITKDFAAHFYETTINPMYRMSENMGQNNTNLLFINLMGPFLTDDM